MIGVGGVNKTVHALLVAGIACLVAGASSMGVGEYVSVKAQYEIEKKERNKRGNNSDVDGLPSPKRAAAASFVSFAAGASLPLLAGGFITSMTMRLMMVCAASSVGFAGFGAASAFLGGGNLMKATMRTLVGGLLSMAFTFGVVQLFAFAFHDAVSTTS
ncbi:hypothetical protein HPP92_007408 [Vanilla planifolia]|uniref:Vacuolar iron transporter n=1 Tax=Vanilla planifolia TaxID=51239 RepID=A0A835RMC2_VANPL|nr:hypothetical protein HPP92_007408 [Vanilla planifolia]